MWLTSITHFPEMLLGKRYSYGKGQFCMALYSVCIYNIYMFVQCTYIRIYIYICADGHTIEAFRQRQKGLIYTMLIKSQDVHVTIYIYKYILCRFPNVCMFYPMSNIEIYAVLCENVLYNREYRSTKYIYIFAHCI